MRCEVSPRNLPSRRNRGIEIYVWVCVCVEVKDSVCRSKRLLRFFVQCRKRLRVPDPVKKTRDTHASTLAYRSVSCPHRFIASMPIASSPVISSSVCASSCCICRLSAADSSMSAPPDAVLGAAGVAGVTSGVGAAGAAVAAGATGAAGRSRNTSGAKGGGRAQVEAKPT